MDSPISDSVVHVDARTTWTDALVASLRPSDHHVSDEEIFEILDAGSDPEAAAELFAAKGVTVPMYCVWKVKYRHLSLEKLREVRRRESWRTRSLFVVILAAAVLGAGGIVALGRAAHASITAGGASAFARASASPEASADKTADKAPPPLRTASLPTPQSAPERKQAGPAQQTAPPPAPKAPPVELETPSAAQPTIAETGYRIQVAAANSLQEGRVLILRLASAGYPAYMLPAIVGNTEVFRVRIGPFETLPAAEEIASLLKRDGFTGAWIAR